MLNDRNEQLTIHDDMVILPEEPPVLECRLGNASGIFPILPLGPVLPEVDTVPQLLSSERAVSEDEIVTALDERGLCSRNLGRPLRCSSPFEGGDDR